MVTYKLYNEAGELIDQGLVPVRNIGYITMPLATNKYLIEITSHVVKEEVA